MTTVGTFIRQADALLALSRLQAAGIEGVLSEETSPAVGALAQELGEGGIKWRRDKAIGGGKREREWEGKGAGNQGTSPEDEEGWQ